jgi:hypothetical protein
VKALVFIVGLLMAANLVGAEKFSAVDIFVDSGSEPLAAFQIEFRAGSSKIVGIEGGEHQAFKEPARYDPKALQQNRVILAAFSIAPPAQLPKGKTRVATLHLHAPEGVAERDLKAVVVANGRGERIDAAVTWRERIKQ